MSSIKATAEQFFEACETGKGWDTCQRYCHADASFSVQAGALAGVETLQAYTDWMKGIFTPMPNGSYELKSFGVDQERGNVCAFAVYKGTHTGEGGPVPPTGKTTTLNYVYVMDFEDGRISHITKIWNADHSLRELGWLLQCVGSWIW